MSESKTFEVLESLFKSIRNIIKDGARFVSVAANAALVKANWEIGRLIVEDERKGRRKAEYGKAVLKKLSGRLMQEFGDGYTERNLRYMRSFYLSFPIRNALRSELGWTHYRILMREQDPMMLEFLSLPQDVKVRETKLESAIISHLKVSVAGLSRPYCRISFRHQWHGVRMFTMIMPGTTVEISILKSPPRGRSSAWLRPRAIRQSPRCSICASPSKCGGASSASSSMPAKRLISPLKRFMKTMVLSTMVSGCH